MKITRNLAFYRHCPVQDFNHVLPEYNLQHHFSRFIPVNSLSFTELVGVAGM
jgi:hypothetical protein